MNQRFYFIMAMRFSLQTSTENGISDLLTGI